jgi:hypothetical protein
MGKRLFWTFLLSVALVTTAAVIYIQSEAFARIVRTRLQESVTRGLGVDLNFDRLKIGVLPPSVSLVNVDLKVSSAENKLHLTPDTVFKAGSLGLSFRMIQAFSSGIAVNKVFLSDAVIKLVVPRNKDDEEGESEKLSALVHKPIRIELTRNFAATIRQLEVKNTQLDLTVGATHVLAKNVGYLALTPSSEGTNLTVNVDDLEVNTPKVKERFKAIRTNLDVQRSLVQISVLDLQRREAALHASGKLVGSIDAPLDLRADLDVILRGPVRELSDFEKALGDFEGDVLADAKVVGRLKDPEIQGKVEVTAFKHGLWALDKAEVSGSYGAGLLVVDNLVLAANGGRASLKNKLEVPIPFKAEPAAFQLKLEGARFEDFAGDVRKKVNNLRLKLDGVINARLEFAESGGKVKLASLNLKPEVKVSDLELNNQAYGKNRPYKRIFKVQPFQLDGNVAIKNGDLQVTQTKFTFPTGSLDVSGSHTDDGYDLTGVSTSINLGTEVGDISSIPIQGSGAITVHVHGPDKAVLIDFDVSQQNAKFVRFDFGNLTGRVTYDDDHDLLLITNAKGKHGGANFAVNGKVFLNDTDAIELKASFEPSPPDDLFAIFAHQLEKITWIPHGMTGTISGVATVGGKYTDGLDTLDIDANVSGRNLAYKGETVQEIDAEAGVKKSLVFAHDVRANKYSSRFTGFIDYDLRNDEMKYRIDSDRGKLRSLDFFTAMDIPLDGLFSFHGEGKGKWETLASKSRFDVSNAFVRTRPIPPLSLAYDTTADSSSFSGNLGSTASLAVKFANGSHDTSTAELNVQRGNFDYLLCILSRSNCSDSGLGFLATADGKFTWKGWDWQQMSGSANLQELTMAKTGYSLRLPSAVKITASNGLFESGTGSLEGEDTKLAFRLRGRANGSSIDESLKGAASLKVLEFLTPLIEEARGRMSVDLGVTGDVKNAAFKGSVAMDDGTLRVGGLDAPVENLEARLRVAGAHVSIEKLNGQLGGGTLKAKGGMDLFLNRVPRFNIDLEAANNRIKFPYVTFAEISYANLNFAGDAPPYLFSGTAHFKKVMMRDNFNLSRGQKGLTNAKYLPEKVGGAKSFYEVRIRALADGGIFVDNDLLNAEFQGEVTLLNNFEFPQVVGRADLVRGKLLFRNNTFVLDGASFQLLNQDVFEPQFWISGAANVDAYRITLFVTGTLDHNKITLSSYPALPQEDLVSLLAFGYRGEETRHVTAGDTSAITYSEVSSLLMDQLQLSQNLQSKGVKVTVSPSVIDNEASLLPTRPNSAVTAAPKVSLQSQVMKNLDATLGGTVGAAQGQNMDAKLEYHLNQRASVRGVYTQSATGLDANDMDNSYGADLRFRWEFK